MAANVLNSERAVQASVQVVRAFVRLREILSSNSELARKFEELERKYDRQFRVVFDAIRQLMRPTRTAAQTDRLHKGEQIMSRPGSAASFRFAYETPPKSRP